jgi:hypothetical protein
MTTEQRSKPRISFPHNHTLLRKDGAETEVDLKNLSVRGAAFDVRTGALAVGDRVELAYPRLDQPSATEPMWLPAVVSRLEQGRSFDRIGLELDPVGGDELTSLRTLLEYLGLAEEG